MQDKVFAIFWDYENVPFMNDYYHEMYNGLKAFIKNHQVQYAKVYYRKNSIGEQDLKIIKLLKPFQTKLVKDNKKNAVDRILIQSCESMIKSHPNITNVLLITGDMDFYNLIRFLQVCNIKVGILGRNKKDNRLYDFPMHFRAVIDDLVSNPQSWWKNIKLDLDKDPYGETIFDDGDGEFQAYDYDESPFNDDESDDEMIYESENNSDYY